MPVVKYSEYEQSRSVGGGAYMQLEEGDNKIRIISDPYHFQRTFHKGDGPKDRFGWAVIDKTDKESNEVKVRYLEVGPMIYGQVVALVNDEDYGDPTEYDIKIKKSRTGDEKFDVEYHVIPGPKSPLTVEEKDAVDEFEVDFEKYFSSDGDEDVSTEDIPF